MARIKFVGCVFLCALLASCAAKGLKVREYPVASATPDPAKPPDEYYVIGAGDSLNIQLWKEPTLSGPVTVRPDGFVTLPLVNEVQVVGLTTWDLRKLLEKKFNEFVNSPVVTIRVEGIASAEVFVVGQVNKAGAYPLKGKESLLQLITRAGGLTTFAERHNVRTLRRTDGKVTEYISDYDAIIAGDLTQDIILKPGDRIIVP
jgi:polysaccharide export outer membrane protein